MTLTHIHHIIPKHMGGTNDPSNLVELTVAEHAEAHRLLFEQYGKREDYLAWQGLLGRISKEEIIRELASQPLSEERKQKISKALKGRPKSDKHKQNMRKPKEWTEEGKQRLRDASSKRKTNLGKKMSDDQKEKLSAIAKNRPKAKCPHCSAEMSINNLKRYHLDNCKNKVD